MIIREWLERGTTEEYSIDQSAADENGGSSNGNLLYWRYTWRI